jgi:hypothetical protein
LRSFAYNILKCNQADTTPQDRLAAAFGGFKSTPLGSNRHLKTIG